MIRSSPTRRRVVIAAVLCLLTSCKGGLGPSSMRFDRNQYNMAMQQTDSQELLLNLVRLRYRDTPFFLQVASVSANVKLASSVGTRGEIPSSGPSVVSLDGRVAYESSPTVTYTPLQGEQFVKQLLEPIELQILLLITSSGWSVDRALRLLVQEINGVPNAPTASGPTPSRAPQFEEFLRISQLLRFLQERDLVDLSTAPRALLEPGPMAQRVFLVLKPEALALPQTQALVEALGLAPDRRYYEIVSAVGRSDPTSINIVPRSVISTMFYTSQSVIAPERDEEKGRVTITRDPQGGRFDWSLLLSDLIRIESGDRPEEAYVAVRYRGHWFWIDDSDLDSKSTFTLLTMVLALQAGEVPSTGPVLTLPVSR